MVKDDKKLADWQLDILEFDHLEALGLTPDRWWEGQRVRVNFKNGEPSNVQIGA
jgi:hypothetical protein